MCFGFLGIQYGFGLQQANLSPIFRYHGANESERPILWLAGPVTGLLIQPLIGAISDRTWTLLVDASRSTRWRPSWQRCRALYALCTGTVDGRGLFDFGRGNEYRHGALPSHYW